MVFFTDSQHLIVDIRHCGSCESCLKRYIESPIRDFHVASDQIWMLQLPTNTEFFYMVSCGHSSVSKVAGYGLDA